MHMTEGIRAEALSSLQETEKKMAALRVSLRELDKESNALLSRIQKEVTRVVAQVTRGDLGALHRELEKLLREVASGIQTLSPDGGVSGVTSFAAEEDMPQERFKFSKYQSFAEVSRALEKAGRNL